MIRQPASFIAITLIAIVLAGASALAAATSRPANVVPMSELPEAPGGNDRISDTTSWKSEHNGIVSTSSVTCVLFITTTSDGIGPNDFHTAVHLGNYTNLALAVGNVPTSPVSAPAFDEYFRLDNTVVGASYKVDAIPDYATNYNLGLIIYDVGFRPIMTDTNTADNNSASLTLVPGSGGDRKSVV